MEDVKIKKYQKKFSYSYAFGTFPTIEMIKEKKEEVIKVLIQSDTDNSEGVKEVVSLCEKNNVKLEIADRLIRKIAVKENTYTIGVFKKYNSELSKGSNHLMLVEPRNMGNVGTIIRTMLGFNFNDLAIIRPAADIFDPSVIRSTMGAIFHINFEYFDSVHEYLEKYPDRNIYTFMLDGAEDIRNISFKAPYTMIQGNESKGLPEEYKNIGKSIFIPNSKKVDSLNLSIATAIGLWEARRKDE